MFQAANPCLLIIDVQEAIESFSEFERNNPDAEDKITELLHFWRENKLPLAHIRHSSKFENSSYHQNSPKFNFKKQVKPESGEKIITKQENCAFIGTDLDEWLKQENIHEVVICGVITNNSVDATVRVAAGLGYRVFVPHDATATFEMKLLNGKQLSADDVHWTFLSNLQGEYGEVVSSDQILRAV